MGSVTDNQQANRFELESDGVVAELVYQRDGKHLVLEHTEVPEALEGRGIGGSLVTAAIERAEREGFTVIPRCPFARRWLERHPDIAGRVPVEWPMKTE